MNGTRLMVCEVHIFRFWVNVGEECAIGSLEHEHVQIVRVFRIDNSVFG